MHTSPPTNTWGALFVLQKPPPPESLCLPALLWTCYGSSGKLYPPP